MHACPRCWEVIEHPAIVTEASLLYEATGTEPVAVAHAPAPALEQATAVVHASEQPAAFVYAPDQTAHIVSLPASVDQLWAVPSRRSRRQGIRFGRLVLVGVVGGLFVAVGLIALEAVAPELQGTQPDKIRLVREGFPDLDFGIGVPEGWDVRNEDVDSKPGVAVFEPVGSADDERLRRFNVVGVDRTFARARELAGRSAPASARDYEEIDIIDGLRLDGRPSFRHRYGDGDEYREEWWVQRGNGTYRIEFTSPMSRREESAILFVRIARSFDVL